MATDKKSIERVERLFADIHRMAQEPPPNGRMQLVVEQPIPRVISESLPMTVCDTEALYARIEELEGQLREYRQHVSATEPTDKGSEPSAPILYEKQELGFAFVDNTLVPIQVADQARSEMEISIKSPILESGKAIGEVQVADPPQQPLTPEDVSLANAVAQQASIQIQNLRLLASAERARTEAQEATRQFTHKNWESFLDAIHNKERIGYVYNQTGIEASHAPAPDEHDHLESVDILDEQVGRLFVKADANHPITEDDKALINSIAKQIGQQVENIRLLADAARARVEAEEATRRLTRQNWETYADRHAETLGFIYDSNQVLPLESDSMVHDISFEQPLIVRGEPIGQLSVAQMPNLSQEQRDLAASIALQAGIHLEALRLTEELQKRATELQELDRLKSAFLANMSHELRTPLNSILGFSDVILEGLNGPLTENMDNDVRLIQKNGQHLLHLINDVLDMAKIESGKMNLNPEIFKVHHLFEEVVSITSTLASEKNLALFIDPTSDRDIEIYADTTRLRQVMINLVNNAIKFTETGKIILHAAPMDGARVLISVKDSGIGIMPDHLEAVFQEFTQVDTTTTRKVGGTGLGLPISRKLVTMHGGRLWAESTGIEGAGSTFYVELPLEARITEVVEKLEK